MSSTPSKDHAVAGEKVQLSWTSGQTPGTGQIIMSDFPLTERAIWRLSALDWRFEDSLVRRYAGLMTDYLKAAAAWVNVIDATGDWPFADFARFLRPDLDMSEALVESVHAIIDPAPVRSPVKVTCINFVRWSFVMDVDPFLVKKVS